MFLFKLLKIFLKFKQPQLNNPKKKCAQTTSNLNNLKVIELRQKCKECGICKYSKMNKSELVNALELINVTSE